MATLAALRSILDMNLGRVRYYAVLKRPATREREKTMKIYVGAPMSNQRVFVTVAGDDVVGGLFEYFWNGEDWAWTIHGQPPGATIATAPSDAIDDDKFFVATKDGRLFQRWFDGGTGMWHWQDHGRAPNEVRVVTAAATMSNSKAFVTGEDGELYQLFWDAKSRKWLWLSMQKPKQTKLATAPGAAMMDSKLFVTGQDGNLYQLDYADNEWNWVTMKNPPGGKLASAPGAAMMNSKLFVTGNDGNLYQFTYADNEWQWACQSNPGVHLVSAPGAAMMDSKLFVTGQDGKGQDGNLYQLNYADNEWNWAGQSNPGASIISAPCAASNSNSQLFVGTEGGQLYQLYWDGETNEWNWDEGASIPLIDHVFVLMLENRSFDHMLGYSGIKGQDPNGLPTEINGLLDQGQTYSNTHDGKTYPVTEGVSGTPYDPGHNFLDVVCQLCGKDTTYSHGDPYPDTNNSGFVDDFAQDNSGADPAYIMECQSPSQLPHLIELAQVFAVCDKWCSSLPGPTWPNRFFLHAASSGGLDDAPTTKQIKTWLLLKGFAFENGTIFDSLNKYKHKFRIFSGGMLPPVYGLKGINLTVPIYGPEDFIGQVQSGSYTHRYTFMEPCYGHWNSDYTVGTSQHPLDGLEGGEGLIKLFYEVIRNSTLWYRSLIIVTYDEHGGFYDHVQPCKAVPPGDKSLQEGVSFHGFRFDAYGARVPAVVVSPFIPSNTIDHRLYDHSSVSATLGALLGMPPLTERDAHAKNLLPLLSLRRPRSDTPMLLGPAEPFNPFCPFAAPGEAYLDATPLDSLRLDDNFIGFLHVAAKADLDLSPEAEHPVIIERVNNLETRGQATKYMDEVQEKVAAAKMKTPPHGE